MVTSLTIVAPTDWKINEHAIAIERTASVLPFQTKKLLLAPAPPTVGFTGEWRCMPAWMPSGKWSRRDYSRFMIIGLADFIDTNAIINVQWDGYGVNADRWTDEFLEYDYIGAPWPLRLTRGPDSRVGNGGFSLRSKRWLQAGKSAPAYAGEPEDVFCCQKYRTHYLAQRCRIAPLDLALRFSIENCCPEYPVWPSGNSFGFHRWHNPDRHRYRINVPD
ncbi:MAG: DUF5672 family protein [Limisphaerales bacterium]